MIAERATDALVVIILVGAVLWGGTTHPPATIALAIASAVMLGLVAWRARVEERFLRFVPLAMPLCASLLMALLQLVPLPPSMRQALAPETARVEALALAGLPHAGWRPLTCDLAATVHAALRLATLIVMAVALGSLGSHKRRVLRTGSAAAIAALVAVCGLCAVGVPIPAPLVFAGVTRALGRFPFVNPNHAAALLALVLPILVVLAVRRRGPLRVASVALAVAGNAALWATLSRAGVVLGLVAQGVALAVVLAPGGGRARRLGAVLALTVAVGLAVAARPMLARFGTIVADTRFEVTRDAVRMIRDHQAVGAGVGAFPLVFARYSEHTARNRYDFVENEYLQVPLDGGIVGTILVLVGIALGMRYAWRSSRESSSSARAAAVGLGALALHNAIDFNFEAGGVAVAICAAAALAFRSAGPRLPRAAAASLLVTLLGLLALATSPIGRTAEDEGVRLAARLAAPGITASEVHDQVAASFVTHPRDAYLADLGAQSLTAFGHTAVFTWLDRALLVSPFDLFAHRLLARMLARAGLRDQAAGELRLAFELGKSHELDLQTEEAVSLLNRDEDSERLVRVLPEDRVSWRGLLERLTSLARWRQCARVADGLLKRDDGYAPALRVRLEVATRFGEGTTPESSAGLAKLAERLVEVDPSPQALRLAADVLARGGRDDRAESLLRTAVETAPRPEAIELAVQLAERLAGRGQLEAASTILERAMARAVTTSEKAFLHRARAGVEERAGHVNRAALERAEAARLERY